MSETDDWLKTLATLMRGQKEREEALLKVEETIELMEKNAPKDSVQQALAVLLQLIVQSSRVDQKVAWWLLDTFLTLLSAQQKEIDGLSNIIESLTSEKKDLTKKFKEMNKWRKKHEPMLTEIDKIVRQRRRFLDQNR